MLYGSHHYNDDLESNAFDIKLYNTWNAPKPSGPNTVYSDLYLFSDFDLYNNSLNNLIINLDCSFIDSSSNIYNFTISSLVPANFEVGNTVVFRKFNTNGYSELEIGITIPQDRSGFKISYYSSSGKFNTNGNTIKIYFSNFISKNNNHLINGFNDWKLDKIYTREFDCSYWDPSDGGEDDAELEYDSDNYILGVNDIKIIVYSQYRKNTSSYYDKSKADCFLKDECILSKEFIQTFKQFYTISTVSIHSYTANSVGFGSSYSLFYYRAHDKIYINIYAMAKGEILPANSGIKFTVYCYYK